MLHRGQKERKPILYWEEVVFERPGQHTFHVGNIPCDGYYLCTKGYFQPLLKTQHIMKNRITQIIAILLL